MLQLVFTFGAIDAIVPVLIIIVLIAAAAGLARGFDMLKLLGIETLAGGYLGSATGGRGSLARKTAIEKPQKLGGFKAAGGAILLAGALKGASKEKSKSAGERKDALAGELADMAKGKGAKGALPDEITRLSEKGSEGAVHRWAVRIGRTAGLAIGGPAAVLGYTAAKRMGSNVKPDANKKSATTRMDEELKNIRKEKGVTDIKGNPLTEEEAVLAMKNELDSKRRQFREADGVEDQTLPNGDTLKGEKTLKKEIEALESKINRRAIMNAREKHLVSQMDNLASLRAQYDKDKDLGKFKKGFNGVWKETYGSGPNTFKTTYDLIRSGPTTLAAGVGYVASGFNKERGEEYQRKKGKLEERIADRYKRLEINFEKPKEKGPEVTKLPESRGRGKKAATTAAAGFIVGPGGSAYLGSKYIADKVDKKLGASKRLKRVIKDAEQWTEDRRRKRS